MICVGFLHSPDRLSLARWASRWQMADGRRVRIETRRGRAGIALYERVA